MNIIGPLLTWQSFCCSCSASQVMGSDRVIDNLCSTEHLPWTEIISQQGLTEKRRAVEKAFRREIPQSFVHLFERYSKGDCTFHRPREVALDPNAVSAEFGLYVSESLGIVLSSCSNPTRYADYLSGKASYGLTEKMWKNDFENRIDGARLFLPEEFVVSGDIDLKAAEAMFGREMRPELLWLAGWDENMAEAS